MSVVTYNGVTLPYSLTTQFRQEALYDDQGGTDWYLTKYDIMVQSIINVNYLQLIAPDLVQVGAPVTSNAAEIMSIIWTRLMRPRRAFTFTFNGRDIIPEAQNDQAGTVDAKNGPIPQSCSFHNLTNDTFLITYHIVANYWQKTAVVAGASPMVQNRRGNSVLYNRWSESIELDGNNYTRRTREGKYVIRSDNNEGFMADQIRSNLAVLSVPAGFLRESSTYTISPDGLGIQYRIIDREIFKMPPSPAFKASGKYSESCGKAGAQRFAEVNVHLEGSKTTPQHELVYRALGIGIIKLGAVGSAPGARPTAANNYNGGIVLGAKLDVDMYENIVDFHIKCMFGQPKQRVTGIMGFTRQEIMVITPYSQNDQGTPIAPPVYRDRGTAGLVLLAAAYWDPNNINLALVGVPPPVVDNPATDIDGVIVPGRGSQGKNQNGPNAIVPGIAGIRREP